MARAPRPGQPSSRAALCARVVLVAMAARAALGPARGTSPQRANVRTGAVARLISALAVPPVRVALGRVAPSFDSSQEGSS